MTSKKMTTLALLTAIALLLYFVEAQLPPLAPIPGIKTGLANVITLVTLVWFGRQDAFMVLVLRIVLGSMFGGRFVSFLYSFAGGMLCFLVLCIVVRFFKDGQLWVLSVFGALAHNLAQIAVAIVLTSTWQLVWYLPVLCISAVLTGAFTGILATLVANRMPHLRKKEGK